MHVKAFSTLESPQIIIVTITGMPYTRDVYSYSRKPVIIQVGDSKRNYKLLLTPFLLYF